MEYMTGHPLVYEPEAQIPTMLARAHLHLHSIDTTLIENMLRDAGISKEHVSFDHHFNRLKERIESGGHEWLEPALDWIVEHRPEEPERLAVLHGDFHPLNILVCEGRVSGVLDWSGFMIGDPALDIAITRFLGLVAFPYYLVHIDWPNLIGLYSEHYLSECIIDSERIGFYEVTRNLMSLLEGVEGHRGWGHPATMNRLSKTFKARTGIDIDLPF
jgi:aminoglycoside phosphotransferase (APT) family kinase protein